MVHQISDVTKEKEKLRRFEREAAQDFLTGTYNRRYCRKKMQEMLNNLEVADEVVTTGGIVGRVLRVTDDTVLIETGSDRTKIRVLKSSIAENRTVHDDTESK